MNAPSTNTLTTSLHPSATKTLPRASATAGVNLGTVWMILKLTFSIVPVVAGLDKFTNLLTNWENYLNPMLAPALPFSPHLFMEIAGVIEIIAGIAVFYRPRLGALIVSAWLTGIALSLLASGHYLDVAVRDLVMAVSAFALASLTKIVEPPNGSTT